jgi:hypothetical protein
MAGWRARLRKDRSGEGQEQLTGEQLKQLEEAFGGPLSAEQDRIRSLPLERLEALAEALLNVEGMADLNAWLAPNA